MLVTCSWQTFTPGGGAGGSAGLPQSQLHHAPGTAAAAQREGWVHAAEHELQWTVLSCCWATPCRMSYPVCVVHRVQTLNTLAAYIIWPAETRPPPLLQAPMCCGRQGSSSSRRTSAMLLWTTQGGVCIQLYTYVHVHYRSPAAYTCICMHMYIDMSNPKHVCWCWCYLHSKQTPASTATSCMA